MNTKLYDKEKEWLKTKPSVEHCAVYHQEDIVFEKTTQDRYSVYIAGYERTNFKGGVFTHWHPEMSSIEVYGHRDSPLSVGDIGVALETGLREVRALNGVALHRIVFSEAKRLKAFHYLLDVQVHFATSEAQEQWIKKFCVMFDAQYEKISLDKLT